VTNQNTKQILIQNNSWFTFQGFYTFMYSTRVAAGTNSKEKTAIAESILRIAQRNYEIMVCRNMISDSKVSKFYLMDLADIDVGSFSWVTKNSKGTQLHVLNQQVRRKMFDSVAAQADRFDVL
jgi:hypothetical protein